MAITTTPFIRKLEEFQKLAASRTDTKVEALEKVEDPFGLKSLREEMDEIKKKYEGEISSLGTKYEKLLETSLQERTDKMLQRVDRLIDSELLKSGFKERLVEFIQKTKGMSFNEKRSVPEETLEILENGLVKGEVLTKRETDTTVQDREMLTEEDLQTFRGKINRFEREGKIAFDEKGLPYWVNGRPNPNED